MLGCDIHVLLMRREGAYKEKLSQRKRSASDKRPGEGYLLLVRTGGHYARNCPKRPRIEQAEGPAEKTREVRGTHQGRVYNLIKKDMGFDPAVIQGTLYILETPVHTLIDPRAMHLFMSHALARVKEKGLNLWDV